MKGTIAVMLLWIFIAAFAIWPSEVFGTLLIVISLAVAVGASVLLYAFVEETF
jgi:hypothetical protein